MKFKPNYIVIPLTVFVTGYLGSIFTRANMDWYHTLVHPSITPPNIAFPIIWTTIFTLVGASALIIWNKAKDRGLCHFIMFVFVINAILNSLWSYIFFEKHEMNIALYETILLEMTVAYIIYESRRASKLASMMLIPYFLWVGFAGYLTYRFIVLNP